MIAKQIVITGANSYLGRFATDYLRNHTPHHITALISPRAAQPETVDSRIEYHQADLSAPPGTELRDILAKADRLFHFAWTRSGSAAEVSRANRAMIEHLLGALPDATRFWFVSSVSASPKPFSIYGRTKFEAANLVRERGGSVLVCGLVVEPAPPRGPYRMLKKNVARFPLAFRACMGEPPVFPLRLADLGATLTRVSEAELPPATYRMFSPPLGFNTFLQLLEQLAPRARLPLPFPTDWVLRSAALAKKTHLAPAKLCDQVLTFLYKDADYLMSQAEIPQLNLRPCNDLSFFA